MRSTWVHTTLLAILVLGGNVSNNFAQEVPWDIFSDPESDSACDVVNAGNREVVVLSDTGELVVVTGDDYTLPDAAFVNDTGVFFFGDIPFGAISFAVDGDGFRTAWLLALDNTVLELDPVTGAPVFTHDFPDDFVGVPCDAFDLWDDDDFDDVRDEVDDCPLDFGDYASGCPCNVFDEDDDGVNDCDDDCLNTPLGANVDEVGCEIVIVIQPPPVTVIQPPPVTIVCGNFSTLTMALTFGALVTLRLARRRYK
jgi:hypothetical protein